MAANNQGIMHISDRPGGRPWCGNRRAYMSTTPEKAEGWPRICVKCQAVLDQAKARAEAKSPCAAA